jgi:hypothetical protein
MRAYCAPGEGCNSPTAREPCALTTLRRAGDPQAERANSIHQFRQA